MSRPTRNDDSFEFDLAVTLHSHSQRLVNILEWLEPVFSYLGQDPFADSGRGELTQMEVEDVLGRPMQQLNRVLTRVHARIGDSWEERGIDVALRNVLLDAQLEVSKYVEAPGGEKYRPPYLHSLMKSVSSAINDSGIGKIGREPARDLKSAVTEVLRILCIYDLKNAVIRVHEMENHTRTLMEFYSESQQQPEEQAVLHVSNIVRAAILDQGKYAHAKRIELRFDDQAKKLTIKANARHLSRAFSNVMNNAVKYNYTLRDSEAWVNITSKKIDQEAWISVESWGVPITADEIDSGIIFKAGKRGTFARKMGAMGNGIGLTDARKVLEEHGGTLEITSRPTAGHSNEPDYNRPFITTVNITIPIDDSN